MTTRISLAVLCLLAAACGDDDPRTLRLEVIPGHETTAFQDDPPVTRIEVVARDTTGVEVASASAAPGGELDFGELPADLALTFNITGVDTTGTPVVRGRSLSGILLGQVQGDVLPLFAQRLGGWARPPGTLPFTRSGGIAVPIGERYLALTGGAGAGDDPAATVGYDLLGWYGANAVSLPRPARSAISRGNALLIIDGNGATVADFVAGTATEISVPEGLASFADVAGGYAIEASEGRTFLVGATRAETPTTGILVVEADGSLRAAQLSAPRAGAAAAWLDGVGLVVAAGSATAPGIEVLAATATTAVPHPFPPDPTLGAGAVIGGIGDIVLIGGTREDGSPAATRRLAPVCITDCDTVAIDGATLPVALTGMRAFALSGARAIVVGHEAVQDRPWDRSYLLDLAVGTATELPLREPRMGAAVVPAPNGTLVLLGGVHEDGSPALTLEMFFPE
ncbi:hypothetical protein [Chondromyces crocatus]|uniref:Uncharacterized protein n=1 Tax=Chondromyces crocatus TaxID=52 RepID=A0A0K1EI04_CHOCO|nr:hypothetical protein [Chondromyces crocatus]AKT40489.1 uncharacterized protein CMC5_046440 [Chondromyces crocatus]